MLPDAQYLENHCYIYFIVFQLFSGSVFHPISSTSNHILCNHIYGIFQYIALCEVEGTRSYKKEKLNHLQQHGGT